MSKQVSAEDWYSKSHAEIYAAGQAFLSGYPQTTQEMFHNKAQQLREAMTNTMREVQNEVANHWHGQAAIAMQTKYSEFFQEVDSYAGRIEDFGNKLPPLAGPMTEARKIKPPMTPQEEQALMKKFTAKGLTQNAAQNAVDAQKAGEEDHARWQMTGNFSQPVVDHGRGATMDDETTAPPGGGPIQSGTGGGGGTGGGSGGGQGTGGANNLTDGLADKNTKPAFSDGSGNQSGQGQGAGAGSGGGSGGGSPQSGSGGSGSSLGNALSGLGGGSDKTGSGLPLGSTTAAGYSSPSGSGSGTGTLSGPGALRGGAGVPGLGGSAGTNPAGIGGAGIRGGATGMGGMGMAPMGGAHGRGGHGEEDDEHETPEFLINWDNGNELFGDLPKASPGVIGDWSEHERAEQQRRESEKRRYKSLGWNVDFGDER